MNFQTKPNFSRSRKKHSAFDSWKNRTGAACLEAAVCLPVLVIFFIGIADAGRASHISIAVANSCQIGADYAAANRDTQMFQPIWEQKIQEVILRELQTVPGYSPQKVNVNIQKTGDLHARRTYRIEVTYRFQPLFSWPGGEGGVTIRDVRTMVNYR